MEEPMDKFKREKETLKREKDTLKREKDTLKREFDTLKREFDTLKGASGQGGPGEYIVKDGNTVLATITADFVRVLPDGGLNLLTDSGKWYLYAANKWSSVVPKQPEP